MSTTPTTFEVPSSGVYRMTDGSAAYRLNEGDIIPMSLAIALGIEGAAYVTPPVFNTAEQAAIGALAGGGGGGGASFPMAEGVWYDGRTATGGYDKLASEEEIEVVADTAFAQLIYIYEPCIISKVGIRPSVPATTGTLLFSLHTPSANAMVGAKVGDLGEITVTNTYDEVDPLEDTCSVSVEQGWYFIVVSGTAEVFLPFRQSFGAHSFTGPYPARDESVGYLNFGVEITSVGIESAIPADLTAATQEYSIAGVRILFQITHD